MWWAVEHGGHHGVKAAAVLSGLSVILLCVPGCPGWVSHCSNGGWRDLLGISSLYLFNPFQRSINYSLHQLGKWRPLSSHYLSELCGPQSAADHLWDRD